MTLRTNKLKIVLDSASGKINRINRLIVVNYGIPINQNLCVNKFVKVGENNVENGRNFFADVKK